MNTPLRITVLALALACGACIIVDDDFHGDPALHADDAVYVTIDADHSLTTDLGYGAGLFVEYYRGGHWTLWTSCDTEITGLDCHWEASISAFAPIYGVDGFELEGYDYVDRYGSDGLTFIADTAYHLDGIDFDTEPGALVQLEVWLDGYLAPEYVVWFGNGEVRGGITHASLVLQPDAP